MSNEHYFESALLDNYKQSLPNNPQLRNNKVLLQLNNFVTERQPSLSLGFPLRLLLRSESCRHTVNP